MTYEEIQISKDSELMTEVISLIASYAVENDMSPNETIKTVAENMLGLLKIANFENWEKKTLPSVISTGDDCVSRQAAIDYLYTNMAWYDENGSIADDSQKLRDITNLVNGIPPVTPTHGTCKDCKNFCCPNGIMSTCKKCFRGVTEDFYCADFEKRGNEND